MKDSREKKKQKIVVANDVGEINASKTQSTVEMTTTNSDSPMVVITPNVKGQKSRLLLGEEADFRAHNVGVIGKGSKDDNSNIFLKDKHMETTSTNEASAIRGPIVIWMRN